TQGVAQAPADAREAVRMPMARSEAIRNQDSVFRKTVIRSPPLGAENAAAGISSDLPPANRWRALPACFTTRSQMADAVSLGEDVDSMSPPPTHQRAAEVRCGDLFGLA